MTAQETELTSRRCGQYLGAAQPGPMVEVSITDNGAGLDRDAWLALFGKPFYSRKARHHGMGLPIVFGILRACGGGFRLDPATERGMTARVLVPAFGQRRRLERAEGTDGSGGWQGG